MSKSRSRITSKTTAVWRTESYSYSFSYSYSLSRSYTNDSYNVAQSGSFWGMVQ
jgi:hypothetical protein